mgnify:CR=1 FL=1
MFEITRHGAVDVISGREPLNGEATDTVAALIDECCERGQPHVVLDLQHVPLIDSAGLETLLDSRDQCLARTGSIHLAAPNRLCRDILHVTGVDSRFLVFDDVLSAVGSFAL